MDRHHCTSWYCQGCKRWHARCDGTANCTWVDYHEMTHKAVIDAVNAHIREMHAAWTTRW